MFSNLVLFHIDQNINETTHFPKIMSLLMWTKIKDRPGLMAFYVAFRPNKPIKPLKRTTMFIQDDRFVLKFYNIWSIFTARATKFASLFS